MAASGNVTIASFKSVVVLSVVLITFLITLFFKLGNGSVNVSLRIMKEFEMKFLKKILHFSIVK